MSDKNPIEEKETELRSQQKKSEIALILPIAGILLFLTPLIDAFTYPGTLSNITRLIIYIFGFWGILIFASFFLAYFLRDEVKKD